MGISDKTKKNTSGLLYIGAAPVRGRRSNVKICTGVLVAVRHGTYCKTVTVIRAQNTLLELSVAVSYLSAAQNGTVSSCCCGSDFGTGGCQYFADSKRTISLTVATLSLPLLLNSLFLFRTVTTEWNDTKNTKLSPDQFETRSRKQILEKSPY